MNAANQELRVGQMINKLREDQALSLDDMARKTGLSATVLSEIENHMVSPSLGMLIKIAKALEVKMGRFFEEGPKEPFCIVRQNEGKSVSRFASKDGADYGYTYEALGSDKRDRHMEPFVVTLRPTPSSEQELSTHDGEEFIYVMEGKIEVNLAGHKDVLEAGDSIYYEASVPHLVHCIDCEQAKILAVIHVPQEPNIF